MRSGVLLGMLVSHYSTAELVKWRDNSHLRPSAAAFTHKDGHAARLMPLCRLLPLCSHMFACCRVCVCVCVLVYVRATEVESGYRYFVTALSIVQVSISIHCSFIPYILTQTPPLSAPYIFKTGLLLCLECI